LDEVVDGDGAVEDGACAEDGARFDYGAFVNAAISAHHYFVFDDYGERAYWFQDAANLGGGADVAVLADLGAGAD